MIKSILTIIAVVLANVIIYLLGHNRGWHKGHTRGWNMAKMIYGKKGKPGEVVEYNAKTGEENPPGKEKKNESNL